VDKRISRHVYVTWMTEIVTMGVALPVRALRYVEGTLRQQSRIG